MKTKKILLACLILLALLTITTASASENVTDDSLADTSSQNILEEAKTTEMDVTAPESMEYNTPATFKINMTQGTYGDLEIYVNDVKNNYYTKPYNDDSTIQLTVTPQVFGDCKVDVKYVGCKDFTPVTKTFNYYVNNLTISVPDNLYVEYGTFLVEFPEDAEGKVEITIGNITYKGNAEQYVQVSFNGLGIGTHDVNVKFTTSNKKYKSRTYSKKVTIYPGTAFYPSNYFVYGGENCIKFLAPNGDGVFTIRIDGEDYTTFKAQNETPIYLSDLPLGDHYISWDYISDSLNYSYSEPVTVHINYPYQSYVKIGDASFDMPFPKDNTGHLIVWMDNEVKFNGTASGPISIPFTVANNEIVFKTYYIDDDLYSEGEEWEWTVIPTAESPDWDMQITMDRELFKYAIESPEIEINTPDIFYGTLDYYIDGKRVEDINEYDFSKLSIGKHTFEVRASEDDYFNDVNRTVEFEVKDILIKFPDEMFYDANEFVECFMPKNVKGTVKFYIDGKLMETKKASEYLWYRTDDISFGDHTFRVVYDGGNYPKIDMSKKIRFSYKIYPLNKAFIFGVDFIYGNTNMMPFHVPDGIPGTFTVTLDGKKYTAKCEYITYIDISKVKAGNYTMKIDYPGSGKFYKLSMTHDIEIEPQILQIKASNANVYYNTGSYYKVQILDMNGKPLVKQKVDFMFEKFNKATKTDSKGYASIPLKYNPGTYEVSISSDRMSSTKKITIKHVVTLKSVTVKRSAKKLTLQATLKNPKVMKNKQVTFKFNGKTYKAKTNSKGIAKVTINKSVLSKLKVGKKITYQATYLKDTVKKTAKVKK